MKLFNGKQHIDLQNISPFGGMYIPYNLPVYYTSGSADLAAQKELEKSMMKMMYGPLFKYYMMDKFMRFMDTDAWHTSAYKDAHSLRKAQARWIPNDAMLEISHAIRKEGALTCTDCHTNLNVRLILDYFKQPVNNQLHITSLNLQSSEIYYIFNLISIIYVL